MIEWWCICVCCGGMMMWGEWVAGWFHVCVWLSDGLLKYGQHLLLMCQDTTFLKFFLSYFFLVFISLFLSTSLSPSLSSSTTQIDDRLPEKVLTYFSIPFSPKSLSLSLIHSLSLFCLLFSLTHSLLFSHYQVVQIERERALKWSRMLLKWDKYWGTEKLHRRVNKGIPNSVRGSVWKHVLNIDGVKEDNVYEVILAFFV